MDTAAALRLLRKKGIQLTQQRLEIFREIRGGRGHFSSEEIYRRIHPRMPMISLDTIYRALTLFEREGLISRVEVLDDQIRYDPNTAPHHHFVCVRCKRIEDFNWPALEGVKFPPGVAALGRTISRHVEFRGVCARCLERGKGRKKLRERGDGKDKSGRGRKHAREGGTC